MCVYLQPSVISNQQSTRQLVPYRRFSFNANDLFQIIMIMLQIIGQDFAEKMVIDSKRLTCLLASNFLADELCLSSGPLLSQSGKDSLPT